MTVDKCSYEQALETLDATNASSLAELEKKVQEIFRKESPPVIEEKEDAKENSLELPQGCFSFDDLPSSNLLLKIAKEYLNGRGITSDGLLVCTSGRYRNRILIPYYDRNGSLIYYNGRYIGESNDRLRYLGPPKELGIGKSDVVFCPRWPESGSKIYVTEGEFDAMSLDQCGFPSAALGGKELNQKQIKILKDYQIVLCFDADEPGGNALLKTASNLISSGFSNINYVRPCKEFKDWNGLLVSKGTKILRHYVMTHEKKYSSDDWEGTRISMNNV
jgi:hypothetical protein